jgi:hypothetical protein
MAGRRIDRLRFVPDPDSAPAVADLDAPDAGEGSGT